MTKKLPQPIKDYKTLYYFLSGIIAGLLFSFVWMVSFFESQKDDKITFSRDIGENIIRKELGIVEGYNIKLITTNLSQCINVSINNKIREVCP